MQRIRSYGQTLMVIVLCGALLGCQASGGQPKMQAGPPPGYDLLPSFTEEFDRPLDPRRWGHVFADPSATPASIAKRTLWNNQERQVYFDRNYLGLGLDPYRVSSGTLTIRAAPLTAEQQAGVLADIARTDLPAATKETLRRVRYGSGLISTRGGFAQQYGYFETRLRWNGGKGIWPAFWMLNADSVWPPEIDIMEALGHEPGIAYHSTHSRASPRDVTSKATFATADGQFHVFGALWRPDRIDYYIDGRKTASIPTSPDMSQPMYLLVSLAIGGNWPGDPDTSTEFPAELEVDYVRAWRFKSLPNAATR